MTQGMAGILSMLAVQEVYAAGGQLGRKVGVIAAMNQAPLASQFD